MAGDATHLPKIALTLTESWVRRINVGFRPLLKASSHVSGSRMIPQSPALKAETSKEIYM